MFLNCSTLVGRYCHLQTVVAKPFPSVLDMMVTSNYLLCDSTVPYLAYIYLYSIKTRVAGGSTLSSAAYCAVPPNGRKNTNWTTWWGASPRRLKSYEIKNKNKLFEGFK